MKKGEKDRKRSNGPKTDFLLNPPPPHLGRTVLGQLNRDRKYGNLLMILFFKSWAQKSREYSHWIDLTLNSHFEAVVSEIYRTKVRFLSKSTFLGSQKRSNKVRKGPAAPKPIL